MIYIVAILLFGCASCLYYYFTRTFNTWRDKNIAGPKPILFFGNLKETILRRKNLGMLYKEIYDVFPNEKVIGIYRTTCPTLIIRDLDLVKQILVKDFDYFSDRGMAFGEEGLGDNIFHCDRIIWQALHGHFTPLFTPGKLKNTFHLFDHHADQLVTYLESVTGIEPEQELFQYFRKYAIATTIAALFSISIDFFNENHEDIEKAAAYIFRSSYTAEMDMLFPNILKKLNMSLYPYLVNKFCYDVARTVNNQRKGLPGIRNDVMDVLIRLKMESDKAGSKQSDNVKQSTIEVTEHVMAAQVFVFLAAGFGNNTLCMSYVLFRLASDQKIQDKLLQEIDEVLEKYDNKLTHKALKEMTYLDKVFLEVLRMNPLAHAVSRSLNKEYKIPNTNITMKQGTSVVISLYAIHRDQKLYSDPDKFDPERFSSQNSAGRHPCAYIPFGAGPRSCLGKQMAKIQFCFGIVKILRKFRVEPSERTKIIEDYDPMSTLLATKGGVYVKFTPR